MTTLEHQLLDVVKAQLPESQAQATKELIDDYIRLKEERPGLEQTIDELGIGIKEYITIVKKKDEEITELKKRESNNIQVEAKLKEDESKLKEAWNELKIAILEEKLSNYKEADTKIERFFDRVFKNYTFSKTYNEQLSYSQSYVNGSYTDNPNPHTIVKKEDTNIKED